MKILKRKLQNHCERNVVNFRTEKVKLTPPRKKMQFTQKRNILDKREKLL